MWKRRTDIYFDSSYSSDACVNPGIEGRTFIITGIPKSFCLYLQRLSVDFDRGNPLLPVETGKAAIGT
jgi:hypothetical protein